jgi:acyl-CoA synthetase (AMP-forming)/AMP-acid ligase II
MHIGDIVRRHARARGSRPAITCGATTLTWSELDERVNRLANALLGLGLSRGDRVAIVSRNCHRYFETHFACAKAGLVAVPLNHRLIAAELAYILGDAGVSAWIVDARHAAVARAAGENLQPAPRLLGHSEGHGFELDYEELLAGAGAAPPEDRTTGTDLNVIAYTSGTTGRPKGAMLSQHNATLSAFVYAVHLGLGGDDRALACMPAYVYRAGSGGIAPMAVGAHTIIADFVAAEVPALIESHRITYVMFAPAMVNLLLREPSLRTADLSSLRSVFTGGAPIRPETIVEMAEVFGDVLGSVYGMTEATGIAATRHRVHGDGQDRSLLASAGRPMPLLDVRLLDSDGGEAENGEVGEITLRGDSVMLGYWNDPERTAAVLRDGWFRSGDMAWRDADGHLFLVDRSVDVINSGGINVYSTEVENAILTHPGVLECAVIGVPDPDWGEAVTALVVLREPGDVRAEDIVEHCRGHLASYKKPRRVEVVGSLPRNAMGKLDKKALREPYWREQERRISG